MYVVDNVKSVIKIINYVVVIILNDFYIVIDKVLSS